MTNSTYLYQIKVGSKCKVKKVNGDDIIRRRLLDMGITKGTNIYVRKKAPFKDPIEINLRGYSLTLRIDEAKCIEVEMLN